MSLQKQIAEDLGARPDIDPEAEVERRVGFLADYLRTTGAKGRPRGSCCASPANVRFAVVVHRVSGLLWYACGAGCFSTASCRAQNPAAFSACAIPAAVRCASRHVTVSLPSSRPQ